MSTETSAEVQYGGRIRLPPGCKPSMAAGSDYTRPGLQHGYLTRREDALWLLTTDSYIACAIRVTLGTEPAEPGCVPIGALRLMEDDEPAMQEGAASWRVHTAEGDVTFDASQQATLNIVRTLEPILWGEHEPVAMAEHRFDPTLTVRLAEAIGVRQGQCRMQFYGDERAMRVTPNENDEGDRFGMQMPLRRMD